MKKPSNADTVVKPSVEPMSKTSLLTKKYLALAWVTGGFVTPFALIPSSHFPHHAGPWIVYLALAAVAIVSAHKQLEVTVGGTQISIATDSAAFAIAAIIAPVPIAMIIGILPGTSLLLNRPPGLAWWKPLASASKIAIAVGSASTILHALFASMPTGDTVLPATLLAAAVVELFQVVLFAIWIHADSGMGFNFLRDVRHVIPVNIVVSTIISVVVLPFILNPPVFIVVFLALQGFLYFAVRLSTSENLHRTKSEYLRDAFARYVPAHVADQLADSGQEISLGGEERTITVLFCDIRGFTTWSEKHDAETVIGQLNVLLGELSKAVMETDGTLDKYMGDGLMAFWGAPLEQPDHALLACTAAHLMLEGLDRCNAERAEQGMPPFRIGIGVHSGTAVVGNVGHEDRLEYTAIGDTINLTARLESATKEFGTTTIVSDTTFDQLPASVQETFHSIGSLTVKGRAKAVNAYAISAANDEVEIIRESA